MEKFLVYGLDKNRRKTEDGRKCADSFKADKDNIIK